MTELREWIHSFLEERRLTLSELAARLGYKSKTSLERLMDNPVRPDSMRTFEARMASCFHLDFSMQNQLHRAVLLKVYGQDQYETLQEMWYLIQGIPGCTEQLRLTPMDGGAECLFSERYQDVSLLHVTLFNTPTAPVFSALEELLRHRRAEVRHYFCTTRNHTMTLHTFHSIIPLLPHPDYHPFCHIIVHGNQAMTKGVVTLLAMTVTYERDGAVQEDLIIFHLPSCGMLMTGGASGCFLDMLALDADLYQPVKRSLYQADTPQESLVRYISEYSRLERNRSCWIIRANLPSTFIPSRFFASALQKLQLSQETLQPILAIYQDRVENIFTSRKHIHTIIKREAFRYFLQTGKISSHFRALRPFSPQERLEILRELLRHMRNNPFFHIYLLKDDSLLREISIYCYDGLGLMILPPGKTFDLQSGLTEVILTHPDISTLFSTFYQEELLHTCCLTERESCEVLSAMIGEA